MYAIGPTLYVNGVELSRHAGMEGRVLSDDGDWNCRHPVDRDVTSQVIPSVWVPAIPAGTTSKSINSTTLALYVLVGRASARQTARAPGLRPHNGSSHPGDVGRASARQVGPNSDLRQDGSPALHLNDHHPVPYDENLLERARTQWQFGDWEILAGLDRDTLQHHPDRAKLALLSAAGHLQQGDGQKARHYTRLAQDWGCSRRPICPIRASGRPGRTPWLTWRNGMRTDSEIRAAGLRALVTTLGLVEAERFIALLSREPFDYTEWRKTGLPDIDLRELSRLANQYAQQLDESADDRSSTK